MEPTAGQGPINFDLCHDLMVFGMGNLALGVIACRVNVVEDFEGFLGPPMLYEPSRRLGKSNQGYKKGDSNGGSYDEVEAPLVACFDKMEAQGSG
jgi:hypothetical protein